jgi:hypothetical protein
VTMPAARTLALVSLLAAVACASKQTEAPAPGGPVRWMGTFRQPQSAASAVIGPATPGRAAAFGSLILTPAERDPGRFRVELSISAPVDANNQLAWAIFSGPCGTPSPSVIGLQEFPAIEINGGGGSVRSIMSLPLDPRGSYHTNVYWSSRATDVSNVMMCANLTFTDSR